MLPKVILYSFIIKFVNEMNLIQLSKFDLALTFRAHTKKHVDDRNSLLFKTI